jgi:hypothetical protein
MIITMLAMAALLAPLPLVLLDVWLTRPPRVIARAPIALTTLMHAEPPPGVVNSGVRHCVSVPVVPGRPWSA